MRFFYWKIALYMGLSNPLLGKGIGMFRVYLKDTALYLHQKEDLKLEGFLFKKNGPPLYPTNAHNDFLEFWAEGGLLFFLFLIFFLKYLFKNTEKKLIYFLPIFFILLNSLVSFPFHLPIIFPFIGLYGSLITKKELREVKKRENKNRFIVFSGIFFFTFIFFWLTIQFLLSDVYLKTGVVNKDISALRKSIYLNPVNIDGWMFLYNLTKDNKSISTGEKIFYLKNFLKLGESPLYRYYLALLLEKAQNWNEAINNILRAVNLSEKEDKSLYIWFFKLGYLYFREGNIKKAIYFTKKSLEYNKTHKDLKIRTLINLSAMYYKESRYHEALKTALEARNEIKLAKKATYYLHQKEELDLFIQKLIGKIKENH